MQQEKCVAYGILISLNLHIFFSEKYQSESHSIRYKHWLLSLMQQNFCYLISSNLLTS